MNDPTPIPSINGCLDIVTPEGVVEGWCWDKASPARRPEIVVTVDGVTAGSTIAASFRPDLLAAGIGDGGYGFSFVIPWSMLFQKRTAKIAVFEGATRQPLGDNVLRNDIATGVDDRLAALEGKVRLLESRLAEMAEQSKTFPDTGALFRTVGTFFAQLGQDAQDGVPQDGGERLGTTIEAIEAAHPVLTVPVAETPLLTICIEADAPLAVLHGCVASVLEAQAGGRAELVLLDPGRFDDAALLPVVVRNIRTIRTLYGAARERNAILRRVRTPFVVFLSGRASVSRDWLDEILATFERQPQAGAVGGCAIRGDGLLERGGLLLGLDRQLLDQAAGRFADDVAERRARPVHALPADGVAIRREALLACNGLDESFDTLAAAVIDLCFRLGERNWSVVYQPFATMAWRHPAPGEPAEPTPLADETLAARWLTHAKPAPRLVAGEALLTGRPGADLDALLRAADRLQTIRYAVSYTVATLPDEDGLRALARHGVAALPWPGADTPFDPAAFDLIWAPSDEAAAALREAAPAAAPIMTGDETLRLYCLEYSSAGTAR